MTFLKSIPVLVFTFIAIACSIGQAHSVADYVKGALKNSYSTKAALDKVHESEVGLEIARAAYLPTANLSYSVSQTDSQSQSTNSSIRSRSGPGVSLSWLLWDNGLRNYSKELAQLTINNSDLSYRNARQSLILQTLLIYNLWDYQSNLEYFYSVLISTLQNSIPQFKISQASETSIGLLEQKIIEWQQRKATCKIAADSFSIQLEGLTGLVPQPYVEFSQQQRDDLVSFYFDLTVNRPIPSLDEALILLDRNNLSLRAAAMGIDALKISQALSRSLLGPTVSATASWGPSSTTNSIQQGNFISSGSSTSRSRSIGVSVSVPLDAKAYLALRKEPFQLSASENALADLRHRLETDVKGKLRQVNLLREDVVSLKKQLDSAPMFKGSGSVEKNVANLMTYYASKEPQLLNFASQTQRLFSAVVDFAATVYDLEDYFGVK